MTDAEDKTAALLAALWVKIRPLVEERLATLDQAATAATAGALADDARREAASSAHKLAGSLGMYGYDEGTRVARELEVLLGDAKPDAVRLSALISELRAAIPAA
ncbi:MAG: Hpt domain-containing protein [Acidobacteriaceae bacterium]|jgi:HPt (histidine-containing phosphotransfer) domain-containing protein